MSRPLKITLVVSLACHGLLFSLFGRFKDFSSGPRFEIAVEILESDVGRKRGAPSRRGRSPNLSLKALSSRFNLNPPTSQDFTQESSSSEEGGGDDGILSAGESRFINSLWRMVDQYIEENPFLSEYNQTGKVSLRFDIDEAGRLTQLQATAANRVLKVIATRAVRKAVLNETGDISFPPRKMSIRADFHWSSYEACRSLRGPSGRSLSFCHYAENKRKNFSAGERMGTWVGAIAQHGPWAYEEIQKYNRQERRRKSQFNPFRKYELDPDWNL